MATWPSRGGQYADRLSAMPKYLVSMTLKDPVSDTVFPIVVGTGRRCFGDPGRSSALRPVSARSVGDEVAILRYEPAQDRQAR